MAFVFLSRSRSKPQASVRSLPQRRSFLARHSSSQFGFATPGFQPSTRALPTVPAVQTKMKVGESNDKFEQEADRMAVQVMRMPDVAVRSTPLSAHPQFSTAQNGSIAARYQSPLKASFVQRHNMPEPVSARSHLPRIQRMCSECEEEVRMKPARGRETVQTSEPAGHAPESRSGAGSPINVLRGEGQPLSQSLRAFFEPRFNLDFSSVRLHTGAEAARSARDLGARAFTVGNNIVFGGGEFAPGATGGRNLLAHELTHVVQQSSAQNPGGVQLKEQQNIRRQKIDQSCAGRESDITEGFEQARRLTADTINKLESADDLMGQGLALSAVNPVLATTIQNAFGKIDEFDAGAQSLGAVVSSQPVSSGSGRIRKLINNYRKVADRLNNENTNARCDQAEVLKQLKLDEDFCEIHGAFVLPKRNQFKNDVFLCPNFLAADAQPVHRGLILLHEMSHNALGIEHEGGRIQDFSCAPIGLTFNQAIKNAYAYEVLAECLHRDESEMVGGEHFQSSMPAASARRDRVYRLSLGVDVSPSEERVLRRFATLSLDVGLGKNQLGVFSKSIGFKLLSLPGSGVQEQQIAAAMVDIGLRVQQPRKGVYLDVDGGFFAGARFEPGKDIKAVGGVSATIGAGYHFKNFEIGAEATYVDPTGDDSRIYFVGRGAVSF
jgi:uncharacterized protein DUF4157